MDELNLPWKIYFFDSNGLYFPDEIMHIRYQEDINSPLMTDRIRKHNENKLEVRITDSLDYCIMHFKDGKRIFPL